MNQQKNRWLYRCIKGCVRFFYPKMTVEGLENIPDGPAVIVGNHAQMNGPIACQLYLPEDCYTWCAGQMMALKEVPGYAYQDFWSKKPKITRPFYKLLSYIIAPLSVVIFNNARTIGVYRDRRVLKTFRETVSQLQQGNRVVIFPEQDPPHNAIVYEFQQGFVDVARLYYKRTGQTLSFVPLYIAPRLKKMCFGAPVQFSPDAPIGDERQRICAELMDSITRIAVEQPAHTVVPYRNIPKKHYPTNLEEAES